MSFIIVEIPHQRSASAWEALSEQEIIDKAIECEREYIDDLFGVDAEIDLELAKEALFHDLHMGMVLTEEESRRFVSDDNDVWTGHQQYEARAAVRKILDNYL
jgi:hypothetical protein